MKSRVERYARELDPATKASVRAASAAKVAARRQMLGETFVDPEAARSKAALVKSRVLDHLPELLAEFEHHCQAQGIQVHHAENAGAANAQILAICKAAAKSEPEAVLVVKAKSMASEEIHINRHLEEAGFEVVETDLGEFVVQIDHDTPSHIVTPIIHKNRKQVAESFARERLGPYTEVAEELAMQAREYLRGKFRKASIGVSGVNFGIASSGRLAIVENEGNNRYCTTTPRVHIAIMGIEKLVPSEADLAIFLPLLAGSATGQRITTYVHFIKGPRRPGEMDGPEELHLILLDNGRRRVLDGPYRDILRCIRCGACLNVCPVYREASGHGYEHVYSGPLGAVLAPALEGVEHYGDLAKASSLCGACEEVCPVKISIPHMLLKLRNEGYSKGAFRDGIAWEAYASGAQSSFRWKTGLTLLPLAEAMPTRLKNEWTEFRNMPYRAGRRFRFWWKHRRREATGSPTLNSPGAQNRSAEIDEIGEEAALYTPLPYPDIWRSFLQTFQELGGKVIDKKELDQWKSRSKWVDSAAVSLAECDSDVERTWDAEVGFAFAKGAIAQTGTLLFESGPGSQRLTTLVPPVNVVFLNKATVVPTLAEALNIVRKSEGSWVFVSGPSRTADIEGVLVRGVHGPGELLLCPIEPANPTAP